MGDTKIEWTDKTWNPVRGCSRVSEGCRHCYAETFAARFNGPGQPYEGLVERTPAGPRWTGQVRLVEERLADPLRWWKPARVFVNSMSDLFHEALDEEAMDVVFAVMTSAEQHTFQVLTKRPKRMLAYLADSGTPGRIKELIERELSGALFKATIPPLTWPPPNVWLGVSVEDQAAADERIPPLLATLAAVRFVSFEPLLGPVNLDIAAWGHGQVRPQLDVQARQIGGATRGLDWVIIGGESGPGARPMHPDWARSLRDQCKQAGTAFFFKQWGAYLPQSVDPELLERRDDHRLAITPDGKPWYGSWNRSNRPEGLVVLEKLGKKAAGALLDGREWREFPGDRTLARLT